MICRERKLIFVHIPKCGGTSVEKVVWPRPEDRTEANLWMGFVAPFRNKYQTGGLQHLTAPQIRMEVGPTLFNECFKFAFVRHPVARIVSQYRFLSKRKDLRRFLSLPETYDFDTHLDRISVIEHVQWTPQVHFLFDESDGLLVDKVYRLEDISVDSSDFEQDLRMGIVFPHENAAPPSQPPPVVSEKALRRVYKMFEADFDLLKYQKRI